MSLTSIEICAGGGGQALGLEAAGFRHIALVESDRHACSTLRTNRPDWSVAEVDVKVFDGLPYAGVDLLAGGVPCPPFSVAGKQLGHEDERDLFPEVIRLAGEMRPAALMVENVKGLLTARFAPYRKGIRSQLEDLGYAVDWQVVRALDFGVPQLRERSVLVALDPARCGTFTWPVGNVEPPSIGTLLADLMAANGWEGAAEWGRRLVGPGPTLSGGSKKHGGADLGATRSKKIWASMGVDAWGVADAAPMPGFVGMPKLTARMAARLQCFPDDWQFAGGKTAICRQIGNAFPPPVAAAVGSQIATAIRAGRLARAV